MDNAQVNQVKTQLELLGELSSTILDTEKDNRVFLFVVQPDVDDSDESGTWEGSIKKTNKLAENRMLKLEQNFTKQFTGLR